MILTTEEAEKKRLEEAASILGHSRSYICFSAKKTIKDLDFVLFLNLKDQKNPVLTFEDNSSLLDFPFFVYDDQMSQDQEQLHKGPGYFFIGSAGRPSDFERALFKVDKTGREEMFDLMKKYHDYKTQRIREGILTIGNSVVGELKDWLDIAGRYIHDTIRFKEDSKRAKSMLSLIGHSGNRIVPGKKRVMQWVPKQATAQAYYTKQKTEDIQNFYTDQISFGQFVIDATKERREKLDTQIKENGFLYERISRIFLEAYSKIINEEHGKLGKDHLILTEAVFSALANPLPISSGIEGRVNIISKDHHFQEIPKRINNWKKLLYNSDIKKALKGKKLNFTIYKYAPYLSANTDSENLERQRLMQPIGRISLRQEGRNNILSYFGFDKKR